MERAAQVPEQTEVTDVGTRDLEVPAQERLGTVDRGSGQGPGDREVRHPQVDVGEVPVEDRAEVAIPHEHLAWAEVAMGDDPGTRLRATQALVHVLGQPPQPRARHTERPLEVGQELRHRVVATRSRRGEELVEPAPAGSLPQPRHQCRGVLVQLGEQTAVGGRVVDRDWGMGAVDPRERHPDSAVQYRGPRDDRRDRHPLLGESRHDVTLVGDLGEAAERRRPTQRDRSAIPVRPPARVHATAGDRLDVGTVQPEGVHHLVADRRGDRDAPPR